MAFVLEKAKREKVHLKILLSGASGSGKTHGALLLATGIKKHSGGEIVIINTEGDRAKIPGDEFDYSILNLDAPYTPEKYIEAIDFARQNGAGVIIIDSISHEWNYLNDAVNAMKGNSFQNWGTVKPRHRKMIEKIIQEPIHMIVTGRGKDEYIIEEKDGKKAPRKIGLGIQSEKDLEYEFQLSLNISQNGHTIEAMKDNTKLFANRFEPITEKDGEDLFAWANSGKEHVETPAEKLQKQQNKVFDLIVALGGSKNDNVIKLLQENKISDPRDCQDLDTLTKVYKELEKIEVGNKESK